jgi:hypothetical protein
MSFKYLCHQRLTGRVSVVEREEFPVLAYNYPWRAYVDKSLMTASFMEISRTLNVDISSGRQYVQKKQTFGVFRHGSTNSDGSD